MSGSSGWNAHARPAGGARSDCQSHATIPAIDSRPRAKEVNTHDTVNSRKKPAVPAANMR